MKINRDRELNLSLYRHWTLFKSLQHTPYTAMKFRTFSLKGEDKLHEFLADLGIPLNQVDSALIMPTPSPSRGRTSSTSSS